MSKLVIVFSIKWYKILMHMDQQSRLHFKNQPVYF